MKNGNSKLFVIDISNKKQAYIIYPAAFIFIILPFIIKIPVKFAFAAFIVISVISIIIKTPEIILSCFILLCGSVVTLSNPYNYKKEIFEYIKPVMPVSTEEALSREALVPFKLSHAKVRFDLMGESKTITKMYKKDRVNTFRVMPVVDSEKWDRTKPVELWAYCAYYRSYEYCSKLWSNLDNKKVKLSFTFDKNYKLAIEDSIKKHDLIVPKKIIFLDVHKDTVKPWHIVYFISSFLLWITGTLLLRKKIYRKIDEG